MEDKIVNRSQSLFNFILVIIFTVLSLFLIAHHEPCSDEAQGWLIARDSSSIIDVFKAARYETTPGLWHTLLFLLAKTGLPYSSMFILHFLLALSTVIIFVYCSPFSKLQKALIIFGYYIFYEYNVIARSYILTILFLFLIAAFYQKRHLAPVRYCLLLFLLANSNAQSLMLAGILLAFFLYETFFEKHSFTKKYYTTAIMIIVFGIVFSIYQMFPPQDITPTRIRVDLLSLKLYLLAPLAPLMGAFFPFPKLQHNFWNSKLAWILPNEYKIICLIFTGIIFLFTISFFYRNKKLMIMYISFYLGSVLLFFLKYSARNRHQGFIFLVFIFTLWLVKRYEKMRDNLKPTHQKTLNYFLIFLLSLQVLSCIPAVYYELNYPFSAAKNAVAFLEKKHFTDSNNLIVVYPAYSGVSLLPFMPKTMPRFFYLEYNNFGSFVVWKHRRGPDRISNVEQAKEKINRVYLNGNYNNILVILNEKRTDKDYELIAVFDQSIEPYESFYIYKMKNKVNIDS